ncbi:MAG: GH25 family lysozyme [Lachnospiraceae bacterium]
MDLDQKNHTAETVQRETVRTPRQRRERKRSIAIIFFAMLSFLAVLGCLVIFCYFKLENNRLKEQVAETTQDGSVVYTQEELNTMLDNARKEGAEAEKQEYLTTLKELMLSGEGTVPMLRYFFPDQIVFVADGSYHFMEIDERLEPRPYLTENLVIGEDQVYEYYEDGQKVSRKGIDVSSFQGVIDWESVAQDGVEFAIIRMGIRGYGTGKLVVDEQFEANIEGALAAGLDVGVYFFSAAVSEEEAIEEADFLIEAMAPYGIQCTVVLDIEDVNSDSARTNGLTKEQWTDHAIAFCERVKEAGYTPMIYGNLQSFMLMLDLTRLEEYDKWFAAYIPYFYYPYDFEVWQYSDSGTVSGISEPVDLNISFYDWTSQKR